MASKMICLFLLGMLPAVHATADSDEAVKIGMAMSKFMPAGTMPRPVAPAASPVSYGMKAPELNTLVDMEARSQEMQVEYQHLRARIQKMPQADDQVSVGSAVLSGWLAGFLASVGLAVSVGVAAFRKYSGHGEQGLEPTSRSQIALVPQRAGHVMASAAVGPPRSGDIHMGLVDDIKAKLPEAPALPKLPDGLPNLPEVGLPEIDLDDTWQRINKSPDERPVQAGQLPIIGDLFSKATKKGTIKSGKAVKQRPLANIEIDGEKQVVKVSGLAALATLASVPAAGLVIIVSLLLLGGKPPDNTPFGFLDRFYPPAIEVKQKNAIKAAAFQAKAQAEAAKEKAKKEAKEAAAAAAAEAKAKEAKAAPAAAAKK